MLHNTTSYIYLLIYILLWAIACYAYYKTVKLTTGTIIISSYLIYGVLAFCLYYNSYSGYKELTLFPFIYLFGMLYIFLIPVFKYERSNVIRVMIPSKRIVNMFLILYALSSLVILPNTISSLREGLTILFLDSYGGAELYRMAQENVSTRVSGVSGIYGLFAIIHNIFSDVALFVISYYLTIKNKNKYLLSLLAIVIIADLLYPMSKGARTDVVMKFFAIIMALSIFYPFYSKPLRSLVKKVLIVISLTISIPFMAMTISRFGEREGGIGSGMLSYIGQAPLNFNIYAFDNGGTRHGDRTINLFKQLAGMNPPKDIDEVRFKYSHHKMDDSIFSTYVGDFVLDFGELGGFLIFVIVSSIFYQSVKIKRNKTISFHSLLIVYFVACVAMQGGMYLFYYSFMQNLQIMAFVFLYVFFYIDLNNQKSRSYLIRDM